MAGISLPDFRGRRRATDLNRASSASTVKVPVARRVASPAGPSVDGARPALSVPSSSKPAAVPPARQLWGAPASEPVEGLIYAEQQLIGPRNTAKDTLPPEFAPEVGNRYSLRENSHYVDASKLDVIFARGAAPAWAEELFFREQDGRPQVLFPVHPYPLMEEVYSDLLEGSELGPEGTLTPSASTRSMYTWLDSDPGKAWQSKMSIEAELGASRRMIPWMEVAHSLFVTQVIEASKGSLPKNFTYHPEFLGLMPKGMDDGGAIIRGLPDEVLQGKVKQLPFFSLYAPKPDGSKPLMFDIAAATGEDVISLGKRLISEYLRVFLDLVIDQGIVVEPHGQNGGVELDLNSRPTGRFFFRDFGGMSVDGAYRKRKGLPMPEAPTVNGRALSYESFLVRLHTRKRLQEAMPFYVSNITGNMGAQAAEWAKKGWLDGRTDFAPDTFTKFANAELERLFREKVGARYGDETAIDAISDDILRLPNLGPLIALGHNFSRAFPRVSTASANAALAVTTTFGRVVDALERGGPKEGP